MHSCRFAISGTSTAATCVSFRLIAGSWLYELGEKVSPPGNR